MRIESASMTIPLPGEVTGGPEKAPRRASLSPIQDDLRRKTLSATPDPEQPQKQAQEWEHLPEVPQHEVTVQYDKQMNDGILIYQLLDKQSGNLVMQVPSTQVLSVVHEIQNKLKQDATGQEDESSMTAIDQARGGTFDGNQF